MVTQKKNIKTNSYKLQIFGTPNEKKECIEYIRKMQSDLAEVGNQMATHLGIRIQSQNNFKDDQEIKRFVEDHFSNMLGDLKDPSYGYQYRTGKYAYIPADIFTPSTNLIQSTIKKNTRDFVQMKTSIPSYNRNQPIHFRPKKGNTIVFEDGNYFLKLPKTQGEKLNFDTTFKIIVRSNKRYQYDVLKGIKDGTYKMCESKITYNRDKGVELMLHLSYEVPQVESNDLVDTDRPTKTFGIDIGFNRPITIGTTSGEYVRQITYGLDYKDRIRQFDDKVSRSRSLAQYAKGGHGRKRKMKGTDAFKSKKEGFNNNFIHQLTSNVMKSLVSMGATHVIMEDLTGLGSVREGFLHNFQYAHLQNVLETKLKSKGIIVLWDDPKYTSQTCHCCKYKHENNRSKIDVTKFVCQQVDCDKFGIEQDADINAAINISRLKGHPVKPKSKHGRIEKWKQKNLTLSES